jgi:cysteine desulfurase
MIYADYNATTPMDPRVIDVMVRSMETEYGNPSSAQHRVGRAASASVEQARQQVANSVGLKPSEVVFTSGATEAINLAIHGVIARESLKKSGRRRQVLVSPTEHKAVFESIGLWTAIYDLEVRELRIDKSGNIDFSHLQELMSEDVLLVAVAVANNETGVINQLPDLVSLVHKYGAIFFTDATQALGKIQFDMGYLNADLAVVSAHKVYGPKGVGALLGTRKILNHLPSLQGGGGQENGLRGGTLNVAGIVGFGHACQIAMKEIPEFQTRMQLLVARFLEQVKQGLSGVTRNGEGAEILSNTVNLRIADADGEAVMNAMEMIAISTGSACQSAVPAPSHVLVAMGLSHEQARECLRFSFGRFSTEQDVEVIVNNLIEAVSHVRSFE